MGIRTESKNEKAYVFSSMGRTAFASPPANAEHIAVAANSVDEQSIFIPRYKISITLPVQNASVG